MRTTAFSTPGSRPGTRFRFLVGSPLGLLLIAALLVPCPNATAGDPADSASQGHSKVVVGAWGTSTDDSLDRVAEYETDEGGPAMAAMVSTHQDWGSLLIAASARDSDETSGKLELDLGRMVRSHTSFDKLLHRLGHDPMENLEGTSINGKVVTHTDLDPLMTYGLRYQVLEHRTELQLPQLPAMTLAVEIRDQKREGHRQAFTTSHCDTCHITSQSHTLNERTRDLKLEAKAAWRGGFARASVSSRELRQHFPYLMHTFDDALHPELQVPVFDNRLQYDSAEGPQIVDLKPDMDKDTTRLDLHLDSLAGFVVNAGAVYSETENRYTRLSSEYSGYAVNAARRFDNGLRLRWRGRIYNIDNDDVFVDTNERVTMAGPHSGQTYEDIYGINYDWWRLSALSRDVVESKLDLSYRLDAKRGTLAFKWDMESIDRDTYQVLPGETETTTNTVGISWRARPAKGWRLRAAIEHAEVDNPFMLVDGACSTLESGSYPNPWSTETPQYDDQHQTRIAETTASPSSWDKATLNATYTAGSTTVSAGYRWWDGDNDDGDLTDWSRTNQSATLTVWSAPAESWQWYAGYSWQDSELNAPVCIPIFDG